MLLVASPLKISAMFRARLTWYVMVWLKQTLKGHVTNQSWENFVVMITATYFFKTDVTVAIWGNNTILLCLEPEVKEKKAKSQWWSSFIAQDCFNRILPVSMSGVVSDIRLGNKWFVLSQAGLVTLHIIWMKQTVGETFQTKSGGT